MSASAPRYQRLEAELRAAIARGQPAVGEQLPTEHALMERYKVSRHTVREALRRLTDAGLIARRRGAGTVVIASQAPEAFAQKLGGVDDLLQYARAARLNLSGYEPVTPDAAALRRFGLSAGPGMVRLTGIRTEATGRPLALTSILVRADLAPPRREAEALDGAVTEWIARTHGVRSERIEQAIAAHLLSADEAAALHAREGAAALITRRRYLDSSGRVIALSESVHPGDRFVYEMTLTRQS